MILKSCPDCGQTKSLNDFPPVARRSDGRGTYCKPCMSARSRESYRRKIAAQGRTVREEEQLPEHVRRCPDCLEVKLLDAFPRNKNARNGRATYCKPCHAARGLETRIRLHGSTRHYHLMRRYGIGAAEVDAMIEAQGGLCALCKERPAEHVDHDHLTKAVRGVLCSCCNQGLGNFRDRADTLRVAIDYLETTTWQKSRVCTGVYRLTSPRPAAPRLSTSSELQRLISSRRGGGTSRPE